MGCDVEFFAFREEPDISILRQAGWLKSWRLFKETDVKAWYLEGPSQDDDVTFFQPLQTKNPPASPETQEIATQLLDRIRQLGGDASLFHQSSFLICAALSNALDQSVIYVAGNDEGLDSYFSFDSGNLAGAKFEIDWDKAILVQQDGGVLVEELYQPGTDPDLAAPRTLHQIAREGVAAYFGAKTWLVSSDPYDFNENDYELICKKGEFPPKDVSLDLIMFRKFGYELSIRDLIKEISPYVERFLEEDLILAENDRRFKADRDSGEIASYATRYERNAKWYQRDLASGLIKFLWDVSGYISSLRPRPEFRSRSLNTVEYRADLLRRWAAIKFQSRFLG